MSTSVAEIDTKLVQPFAAALASVVETMLASDCGLGEAQPVETADHMHTVTSVIGMSGNVVGALSFSCPEPMALAIFERMTGIPATTVDDDVRDAIGEIANMTAGYGKRHLESLALNIGLPQVNVGIDYSVYFTRWADHFWLPATTDLGACSLDVGFDPKN